MAKYDFIKKKKAIQDCNINFLIGSGASRPYLSTLGNIETLLSRLPELNLDNDAYDILRASVYKEYYDGVIEKNLNLISDNIIVDGDMHDVLNNYSEFLKIINSLITLRKGSLITKQVNLFTTNIDIFFEIALEKTAIEFNDGFSGRFKQVFRLSNFNKRYLKTSLHYNNSSEIPVFNLYKVHGSLSWQSVNDQIIFNPSLSTVSKIREMFNDYSGEDFLPVCNKVKENDMNINDKLLGLVKGRKLNPIITSFLDSYHELTMVNPTKEKFKDTVLNEIHYELLRIFSNELERENTLLFVIGFSFADEHIRELTIRALNSNPTLKLIVFTFDGNTSSGVDKIMEETQNSNFEIVKPDDLKEDKKYKLTLQTITNDYFKEILANC